MNSNPTIFWLRRDLRLNDNAALYHALKSGNPVICLFIFDTEILDKLEDKQDKRVQFIHETLQKLKQTLVENGSDLCVKYGKPIEVWKELISEFKPKAVYTNHDYEPYARKRDDAISQLLNDQGIDFFSYKDQVIFEKNEVLKNDGLPYTIYTPYSKKWLEKLSSFYLKPYPCEKYFSNLKQGIAFPFPDLKIIGFESQNKEFPSLNLDENIIRDYEKTRNFPAIKGTSLIGLHLRFGTLSVRKAATFALSRNETFLKELIWREFFMQILWHFPQVQNQSFRKEYDRIQWLNHENDFKKWCEGKTGYPIVDAGMRELNATGHMHNRVRMIVASFLCKHLLIDWRWGEAYFASKLLDYDLSANNGNWQWAAGTGCDAAPYFRVFNPETQTEKFDSELKYTRKWVPEFQSSSYPKPMVDHKMARERVLKVYKEVLSQK